jgi:hypothetical protein
MAAGVFLLKDGSTLVEMQSAEFALEADFQKLLADFPSLLAGDQIDAANPRRWVLVKREKSIPSEDGGGGRWSIDHLFLDQDGIPTLVEVKRQSDSRLRREVVGQMLDYAANGVVYWPIEEIRAQFEQACAQTNKDPEEAIRDLVGPDRDTADFWQQVKTNLQAGRVRMLFVADVIPAELRRVVEFLNQQMDPAQVLALELRQFEGQGLRTLVPRVYGQTEEAQAKKSSGVSTRRVWDKETFLAELDRKCDAQARSIAGKIAQWMEDRADSVRYGTGATGSMSAAFGEGDGRINLASLMTSGRIAVNFGYSLKPPFDDIAVRREFLAKLNQALGAPLNAGANVDSYPSLPLSALGEPERLKSFLSALGWAVDRFHGKA